MAIGIQMILVDTCALLWLASGSLELSKVARDELRKPVVVYVSAVSAWELGIAVAKKKLGLPIAISRWFPEVCAHYRITELPITGAIAAAATELPQLHGDPADRIIIATAKQHNLTILTPDALIAQYPKLNTLW
jgi:PIN domain nuclease of toxin-antitoxin system